MVGILCDQILRLIIPSKILIGSLGSNKTEHAIITVSKAALVIQDIVNNVD
jgi:hypothetical protein